MVWLTRIATPIARNQALRRTLERRPEFLDELNLSEEDLDYLEELKKEGK